MVLFGPDGVLMVDTENRQVAEKTLAAIRSFTNAPIKVLVNTHVHSDHTGANAFFVKQGAVLFAQENLRNEMLRTPQFYVLYAMFVMMATGGLLVTANAGPMSQSWGPALSALRRPIR